MSIHLVRDIELLQQKLLTMCEMAADAIHCGVDALEHPDPESTRELSQRDDEIDRFDVEIEDSCLKILALHQPVATDLRRVTAVLKISSELERIADLGVNIAERATSLCSLPPITIPEKLRLMSQKAVDMLDRSILAYVQQDTKLARKICSEDDEVDDLNREIIDELTAFMQKQPDLIEPAMHLFSASRNVERVADHATNIAEDVIYLVEGEIVRHQTELQTFPRESA
ncbi:MAG: phosphate signaling complex protein PhoU [Planctomycetales bacterium]